MIPRESLEFSTFNDSDDPGNLHFLSKVMVNLEEPGQSLIAEDREERAGFREGQEWCLPAQLCVREDPHRRL